jgi:tetratricopeptide (TPR) repeat protein
MKKTILALSVLAFIFTGCAQDKTTADHKADVKKEAPVKPEKPNVTDQKLQSDIAQTIQDDFAIKETESTKQAIQILAETNNVLKYMAKNKDAKAKEELAKLIGELEILMTKDPNVALIPVDVSYEINDVVVDIPTVYEITEAAKKAMDDGYYQLAKKIMADLTSEMTVKTAYLPLATYPDAMRLAATMLDKGDKEKAAAILVEALNTLVVQEVNVPLPVLRAEEFVKLAAAAMLTDDKDKKDVALLFLDNADYQLQLAEAMGYGKKDKEYKELYKAIKDLKKAVKEDQDSKAKFEKLSEKIKNFKERLFFKKDKKDTQKK